MATQTWEDFLEVDDVREMADVESEASAALQSQYAHAPNIGAVARAARDNIDATAILDQMILDVADARSAKGVFLDWWGKRVGVDRQIQIDGEFVRFDDDYFRFLIFYRAACNLAQSSAADMNRLLTHLIGQPVFIVDNQDMTIQSIVVMGSVTSLQVTILRAYGLLNRPAGVLTKFLVIYPESGIFGFDGQNLESFDNGTFNSGTEFDMS